MFKRKVEFIEWKSYKAVVDFITLFKFQQSVRRANIRVRG